MKIYKMTDTDQLRIILKTSDGKYSFLLSDEFHFILEWTRNTTLDNEIELFELAFNPDLKKFIIKKTIKGIIQYKILSFASFCNFNKNSNKFKECSIALKNIYKELKEMR